MNVIEQKKNTSIFLSLTSLSVLEFEYLYQHFEPNWERYYKYHTLEGKKRRLLSFKEHSNSALKGTEQKLFFLLVYMKQNSLQTFQGAVFGISQSKVSKVYRILLSVLDETLQKMGLSPCRNGEDLQQILAKHHHHHVYFYDGTETPIERNADDEGQTQEYSGKKRGHRLKNLVLTDFFQRIWYLSPTEEGSQHDKSIADEYPIDLPTGSVIKQDLGFLGHSPQGCIVEQPFKKPKNQELSFGQKIFNKILSSTRVVVEHANSGIKRLRMLKDTIRINNFYVRDKIRAVACALHNLRVSAIDPLRKYQTSAIACAYVTNLSE